MYKIALIFLAFSHQTTIATANQPLALVQLAPYVTKNTVTMPKMQPINWPAIMSPMVRHMLLVKGINYGSVLMVNNLKNVTNGNLHTGIATATLTSLITQGGGKFQVVCADKLNAVRQMLGLSLDDRFESRIKATGIARYLNAHYVLYSAASGDVKEPTIDLQLMLVQTGEIVWSGSNVTHS